ncbi:hypothetical protein TIFTF001_021597 [Ficus carica]|uniref:Uncharacterized protein n=1 Tax=Ficus carica TaxID=3494 RepID=A0AA88AKN9_FICCA|nr:hypothetical protein TIFTF001_021597 [Ficus carica]
MNKLTSSVDKEARLPSRRTSTSRRSTSLLGQSECKNQLEDNLDRLDTQINPIPCQVEPKPSDSRNQLESQPEHLSEVNAQKDHETS